MYQYHPPVTFAEYEADITVCAKRKSSPTYKHPTPRPKTQTPSRSHPGAAKTPSVVVAPSPPKPPPVSDFIVDTIFPKHELILMGGPAQSGKTTLVFQIIADWSAGLNVFGYQSHAAPFCYVSCNQSLSSCRTSMHRAGLDGGPAVPILSMIDRNGSDENKKLTFEDVCASVRDYRSATEVIFLDGILRLCPGSPNDNSIVSEFLSQVIRTLQRFKLTLIATGRSAKPKEATNGSRSIDKFLGATAWTEYAETFIAIDNARSRDPRDTRRLVTVMPKQSQAVSFQYRFSHAGRLVEVPAEADSPEPLEQLRGHLWEGREFKTSELLELAEEVGISRATFYRYLKMLLTQGHLEPLKEKDGRAIKEGYYIVPYVQ